MLKRLDKAVRIKFSDIANTEFNISWSDLMNSIHGRLPDGRMIKGVEVFRRLYNAAGFGVLVKISRLPLITNLLDLGYKIFVKTRLALTGRCLDNSCKIHNKSSDTTVA